MDLDSFYSSLLVYRYYHYCRSVSGYRFQITKCNAIGSVAVVGVVIVTVIEAVVAVNNYVLPLLLVIPRCLHP